MDDDIDNTAEEIIAEGAAAVAFDTNGQQEEMEISAAAVEDNNDSAAAVTATLDNTDAVSTTSSQNNKKRRRTSTSSSSKPRKRDTKAPRPPRTAVELYQLDARKDFIQKHGSASLPKDFAARQAAAFDKLSFPKLQVWKVAEAEDLVRYQRQLQQYQPPPGYDAFGNLILIHNDREDSEHESTSAKKACNADNSILAGTNQTVDASKISALPPPHLTLATASFSDLCYELVKFRIVKGHCRVPVKRGGILGKWIEKLRKEYKKRKDHDAAISSSSSHLPDNVRLTDERIQVLSHLGMAWEFPNEDYEELWQGHFQQLLAFKEKHGHCNVPQKGHGKLSWWVKIQRELFVNTTHDQANLAPRSRPRQTMPHHRIRQLESIGFEWRVRPPAMKWEDRFQELLDYKEAYGDCNVPQNFPANRVLGKWVMKQRGFYYDKLRGRKSPLTDERQKTLEEAGFAWVAPHVCKTKTKLPYRENIMQQQAAKASEAVTDNGNGGDATEANNEETKKGDDNSIEKEQVQIQEQRQNQHLQPQQEQQQAQQEQEIHRYTLPPQPHIPTMDDSTQTYRAYPGTNDSAAAASSVHHAADPINAYHSPPPLETAAAMHHLTTDPEHHQPHHGHDHAQERPDQQPQLDYHHPHHAHTPPPPQQQSPHMQQYPTAGQVAASTYPYMSNHGSDQPNPLGLPEEQRRATQPGSTQDQQGLQKELAGEDAPTAQEEGYFPPL